MRPVNIIRDRLSSLQRHTVDEHAVEFTHSIMNSLQLRSNSIGLVLDEKWQLNIVKDPLS